MLTKLISNCSFQLHLHRPIDQPGRNSHPHHLTFWNMFMTSFMVGTTVCGKPQCFQCLEHPLALCMASSYSRLPCGDGGWQISIAPSNSSEGQVGSDSLSPHRVLSPYMSNTTGSEHQLGRGLSQNSHASTGLHGTNPSDQEVQKYSEPWHRAPPQVNKEHYQIALGSSTLEESIQDLQSTVRRRDSNTHTASLKTIADVKRLPEGVTGKGNVQFWEKWMGSGHSSFARFAEQKPKQ